MEGATKRRKTELPPGESSFLRDLLKDETLSNLYSTDSKDGILDVYESTFSDIANNLLNKAILVINGKHHRFVEIEFYYKNGANHDDTFTHGDEIQRTSGKWYFHRMGNGYKGGSYKGIDLTFGGQGPEGSKVYGGILIRAIEPLEGGGNSRSFIEGPSKVVDHILQLNEAPGIAEFVAEHCNGASAPAAHQVEGSRLYIIAATDVQGAEEAEAEEEGKGKEKSEEKTGEKEATPSRTMPELPVHKSSRVGLSLKRERAGLDTFVGRHYRFTSRPAWMKKGKPNMIIALHQQGKSASEISAIMKTAAKTITGYIAHFNNGKKMATSDFMGKALTTQSLCELFGSLSK